MAGPLKTVSALPLPPTSIGGTQLPYSCLGLAGLPGITESVGAHCSWDIRMFYANRIAERVETHIIPLSLLTAKVPLFHQCDLKSVKEYIVKTFQNGGFLAV